jgi:hypothetical protein
MTPHLVKWFALLGFVILVAGVFVGRFLFHEFRTGRIGRPWLVAEICVAVGGVALGSTLFGFTVYASPSVKTVGFPFLAAVFELHDGRWADYVGPLTLPAALGNFAVGVLTPQLILAAVLWAYLRGRQYAA